MRFFSIILALLVGALVFTSCEKSQQNTEIQTLISLHNKSKELARTDVPLSLDAQNELRKAFKSLENDLANKDMDDFWEQYQMSEVVKAAEYLLKNESNENVYEALISNFDLTIAEYEEMFLTAEVAKLTPLALPNDFPDGMEARYACAIAVGFYVAQVAAAVTITGPAGLAWWALGLAGNAASIASSCG